MPLSQPQARERIHRRVIEMEAYRREDGLYDLESHLVDRKPFPFLPTGALKTTPANSEVHDLWIRMTVDDDFVVRAIEASSDVTPFGVCREAQNTLSVLIGERLARGWTAVVKERLRGAASCTHLMEMLMPLATVGLQGIRGLKKDRGLAVDKHGAPMKLDTCYAFGRGSEVVMRLWPDHYRPKAGAS